MKGLILAVQFFTRLPIRAEIDFNEKNVKAAFYFLPLLGGIIGAAAALPLYLFARHTALSAAIGIAVYFTVTGGLHIDGLADTFDGFLSARNKEKILEIMQDPRNGTFGSLALFTALLLRYAAYKELIGRGGMALGLIVLSGLVSRLCGLAAVAFSIPAKETGLGVFFHRAASKTSFFFWLIAVCAACLFYPALSRLFFKAAALPFFAGLTLLLLPASALFFTFVIIKIAKKKIGGNTGDVNGCIVEIAELAALVTAVFVL